MVTRANNKMRRAQHPGVYLKERYVAPEKLSLSKLARELLCARPTLSTLLNGHSGLSPGMALRIEKRFGESADHLMTMQAVYNLNKSRAARKHGKAGKLERVARALCLEVGQEPNEIDVATGLAFWRNYESWARAALEAAK